MEKEVVERGKREAKEELRKREAGTRKRRGREDGAEEMRKREEPMREKRDETSGGRARPRLGRPSDRHPEPDKGQGRMIRVDRAGPEPGRG
jgi:hypothetical protein